MLDMLDFEGREEVSYDELAICISTVIGGLSKVINSHNGRIRNICDAIDGRHPTKREPCLAFHGNSQIACIDLQ